MTKEEMWQKGNEARKAAKALQRKLQTVSDPDERKQLARQTNDLFAEASSLRIKEKNRQSLEESIEREFIGMAADLEDD